MNSFSKDSLLTFFTEILTFVFNVSGAVIVARVLGPEGKGIFSLTILIPGLMIAFSGLGMESSNVYFIGSKKYKIQDIVSNSLSVAALTGFSLIILFWVLSYSSFFKNFISSNHISLLHLWIVVIAIPLYLLLSFFKNILRGKGDILKYNILGVLEYVVQLITIILFLLILRGGIGGAVFSYVLTIIFVASIAVILVRRIARIHFSFNKKLMKDSLFYGLKVYFANIISYLNYRMDMFFIAMFLVPSAVGIYSISVGIAERLFIIPGALATVLFPKVSSIGGSEANDFTPKIVRHTFFAMVICSLLLIFLAKPLITFVFGSIFSPAVLPLVILLPGIIAFGIGGVLAADLAGRGKPQFAAYSSLACFISNIILNIVLIPRFGISGSALASAISYWVDTLVILIAFLKISKKPLSEVLLIKTQDFKDYLRLLDSFKEWIQIKRSNSAE